MYNETDHDGRASGYSSGTKWNHRLGWLLLVALAIAPAMAAFGDAGSATGANSTSASDGDAASSLAGAETTIFEVPRYVIAGGGGHSTGGIFDVEGTIGQAEANPQPSTGGAYEITGGFWFDSVLPPDGPIFSDGFEGL